MVLKKKHTNERDSLPTCTLKVRNQAHNPSTKHDSMQGSLEHMASASPPNLWIFCAVGPSSKQITQVPTKLNSFAIWQRCQMAVLFRDMPCLHLAANRQPNGAPVYIFVPAIHAAFLKPRQHEQSKLICSRCLCGHTLCGPTTILAQYTGYALINFKCLLPNRPCLALLYLHASLRPARNTAE